MDVRFNDEQKHGRGAKTRIYSPSQTGNPTPVLEDSSMPIRPQPTRQPRKKRAARTEVRLTPSSKILILLSVFVIAATALFALFGAADYARIVSNTGNVNKEIDTLNEQISQLRKTQSSMNDFATINDVCRTLGMTMNWYRGSDSDVPSGTDAPETGAPGTAAPATSAPIGDEP